MPKDEEPDAEINETPSEEEEEITQEAPDEAVDEWKLVEMARVVAETVGRQDGVFVLGPLDQEVKP